MRHSGRERCVDATSRRGQAMPRARPIEHPPASRMGHAGSVCHPRSPSEHQHGHPDATATRDRLASVAGDGHAHEVSGAPDANVHAPAGVVGNSRVAELCRGTVQLHGVSVQASVVGDQHLVNRDVAALDVQRPIASTLRAAERHRPQGEPVGAPLPDCCFLLRRLPVLWWTRQRPTRRHRHCER